MDGISSVAKFKDGIAAEHDLVRTELDETVGDPFVVEGKRWPGLTPEGRTFKIMNLLGRTAKFWPRKMVAFDDWPSRGNNEPIEGDILSAVLQRELPRRRQYFARRGIALLTHWAGDPLPGQSELEAALEYVRIHRDDPPEETPNPLLGKGVTIWSDEGERVSMDEKSGVGVRKIE